MSERPDSARGLVVRGVKWNIAYQLFEGALAFAAMLVLVRVIPPTDYGRVGVVVGLLGVLNAYGFSVFAAQAVQLPAGEEPDWSLHWSAGLYLQAALFLAVHGLAALCWLGAEYRPVAPLLHVAALGLVLDWPAQLRMTMLRRAMDFRRLKILLALCNVLSLVVSLAGGLAGAGAYALVLGGNVAMPVPFALDLWIAGRWRPRPGWWRWPGVRVYRAALIFGAQQGTAALIARSRGAMEGAVLPGAVGYVAIGLLSRARALFAITAARPGNVLADTIYPLLPRYAGDRERFARHGTLFAQGLLLALVPGAIYIAAAGRGLSHLLYGERWIAADPLIMPAALAGLGLGVSAIAASLLLASGRLRACTALEALSAALTVPALIAAWQGHGIAVYAWVSAAGYLAAAAVALATTSSLLSPRWARSAVLPPVASSLIAAAGLVAAERAWPAAPGSVLALVRDTAAFALGLAVAVRALFPGVLDAVLSEVPRAHVLRRWLGLPGVAAGSVSPSTR